MTRPLLQHYKDSSINLIVFFQFCNHFNSVSWAGEYTEQHGTTVRRKYIFCLYPLLQLGDRFIVYVFYLLYFGYSNSLRNSETFVFYVNVAAYKTIYASVQFFNGNICIPPATFFFTENQSQTKSMESWNDTVSQSDSTGYHNKFESCVLVSGLNTELLKLSFPNLRSLQLEYFFLKNLFLSLYTRIHTYKVQNTCCVCYKFN